MAFTGAGTLAKLTKDQLDTRMGNILVAIFGNLNEAMAAKLGLFDAHSDTEFEATPGASGIFGPVGYYTDGGSRHDINTLKSAMNEAYQLWQIATGAASQSTLRGDSLAHDYRVACRLVTDGKIP